MEHLDSRQKVTVMISIMGAMLFAALNQTIVGTSLPVIIAEIGGGMQYFNWVFTIFMLTSSVTAILAGKLSDQYGRKPFIIAGLAIFSLGSFLCGTAHNIFMLIAWRGLQGFGGGMIMSTAFTAVGDLFPPRERGRWQGLMGSVFGLASVFGPTLGGYIVDHWDWHWVFWVFLPFGIISFGLIWKLFPHTPPNTRGSLDYAGAALLTTVIVPLLLAFSWGGDMFAWNSAVIIGLFGLTAASLAGFVWNERRADNPVMPLDLFKNGIFTLSNIIGFLMGIGMFGAIMYMPFFIQGVMGISATRSGFIMMSMMLSMVATSTIGGQFITKTGKYKRFALLGLLIMGIGTFSMSRMDADTTVPMAVMNLAAVGLGLGLSFPVFTLTVQNAVQHRFLGVATATNQLFRQLGGTIGVALMGAVMNRIMFSRLDGASSPLPSGESVSEPARNALQQLRDPEVLMDQRKLENIADTLPAEAVPLFQQAVQQIRSAFTAGLDGAFLFGTLVLGCALLLTVFLREIPLRTSNRESPDEAERLKPRESS